ncbi:SH3 and cysteine-rich domain-containing protein [Trichinella britovi]|uniref:SH3 and cysteine-rich domain-containing protein n=2 Tax=Trichinella TaxID=6333 RepID=A0A0V1CWI7_TRIBR|nr:SH3 and cysteine-rich domain-containing protein [Trichinella murrelli]KRX53999.1 SH3 and cysteine-rich domain-containing protein [Trichinella sp. T9]KRY53609.1 SH3 and cysteine-rich domain-containing protein [Trichinella britovi]
MDQRRHSIMLGQIPIFRKKFEQRNMPNEMTSKHNPTHGSPSSAKTSINTNYNKQEVKKHSLGAHEKVHLKKMSSNGEDQQQADWIDPIYLALKMANEMAQRRRSSLKSPQQTGAHCNAKSPQLSQMNSYDSNEFSRSSRDSLFTRKQSCCQISLTNSSMTSSSRSSPGSIAPVAVQSSPNLTSQKSTESNESDPYDSKSSRVTAQHIRKLGMKMKSFSLDCEQPSETAGFSQLKGGHCFKVRPISKQYSSEYNDDDSALESDVSSSSNINFITAKNANQVSPTVYIVTHDFRAKFVDELDLKKGERVMVLDKSDPDWWQGYKSNEIIGRFPSTCTSRIYMNERPMQVVQNLNLWDGSVNLRLYRDQVVFAQNEDEDGLVLVRTEKHRRINCPANYLLPLGNK